MNARTIPAGPILLTILVILAGSAPPATFAQAAAPTAERAWRSKVDPWVLETARKFGETEYFALFEEQADLSAAHNLDSKEARTAFVVERLQATASDSQAELLALLSAQGISHQSYWVANMIWVRSDSRLLRSIALRPDVASLVANPRAALENPEITKSFRATTAQSVEPSLIHVGAPTEFWSNGFRGENVVIGGQDTGYEWNHPALRSSYRGWDGSSADHNYNWHDAIHSAGGDCGSDSPEPCDDSSHGTHTMGTMVGDDGNANRIGLAPRARWIGCRNMDQGVGTPATYAECFEWFLAPTDLQGQNSDPSKAPDVINNSWTCPPSEGCTNPDVLRTVVENVRAAGILVVASAGNAGPDCSTVVSPIAIYDAVLTVGATDLDDRIADFSSRGPVTADGSQRRKPDIAAPGVGIRSSVPGATYGVSGGTSMAGPHVAGVAALSLSAARCLHGRPAQLEKHLLRSALPRAVEQFCGEQSASQLPNNTFGHGVLRAVLPACKRDGRVAGWSPDVSASNVLCRNKSTHRKSSLRPEGVGAWNCMSRGLEASAGDRITIKVTGSARFDDALAGRVDGLDTIRATCRNLSSGQRVRLRLDGVAAWNCRQAGLETGAGDTVKIVVLGRAAADS